MARNTLALALVLLAPLAAGADDKAAPAAAKPKPESFTATVVGGANLRLPGGNTMSLTITVEKWTSPEEANALLGILKTQGKEALLKELRSRKAGFIRPPAISRWPSWEVDVATTGAGLEGRVIRLFTERPIAFEEKYFNTRSTDFEFGVMELVIPADGKGTGAVVPAAKVDFDANGKLQFQTTPFATGPYKLIGVRAFK
ncbi:MAG TPA: hypothetical protein VMV60_17110 [Thermoanaerobaculia bacterium]|nr:hypothetical protein [Thermoanaerobaculia bacterium]